MIQNCNNIKNKELRWPKNIESDLEDYVREGDYKLLLNPDNSRIELYNILTDPGELSNLAGQEPELVKLLSEKALNWFQDLPESPWDETAGQNGWNWPQDGFKHEKGGI